MSHLDDGTLHALLDGEIASADLPPFTAHLEACAECRARLAEGRGLVDTTDALISAIEVPPREASRAIAPKATRSGRPTPLRELAWAATVVIAAGLGYAARGERTPFPREPATLARSNAQESVQSAVSQRETPRELEAFEIVTPPPAKPETQATTPRPVPAPASSRPLATGEVTARNEQDRDARGFVDRPAPDQAAGVQESRQAKSTRDETDSVGGRVTAARARGAPANRLSDSTRFALDEVVVTGRSLERARAARLDVAAPKPVASFRPLGGRLQVLRGADLQRVDVAGQVFRFVYTVGGREVSLVQEVVGDSLRVRLETPEGMPADSVAALRARIE